jgi:hypothetical protein
MSRDHLSTAFIATTPLTPICEGFERAIARTVAGDDSVERSFQHGSIGVSRYILRGEVGGGVIRERRGEWSGDLELCFVNGIHPSVFVQAVEPTSSGVAVCVEQIIC